MTPANYAGVVADELRDRLQSAVCDAMGLCVSQGDPLSHRQRIVVASIALQVMLGFEESVTVMAETYTAIRRVLPDGLMADEFAVAWLRDAPTERKH